MHTVFSTDGSLYQQWQAELLAYSFRRVNQSGPLTRLVSANDPPGPFDGETFQTQPFSPHPVSGDQYPPYNRIGALQTWLALAPPADQELLILDPDCVFIADYDESVERGQPMAQYVGYMDLERPRHAELVKRRGYQPHSLQTMGIPLVIHSDDLRALLPLWMEQTEAIRNDPISRKLTGWTGEMWGYVFAAARLGMRHEMRYFASWPMDDQADLPFIHYCYPSKSRQGSWEWYKRQYKPWEAVPQPPPDVPEPATVLISLLNEFAGKQGHRVL